MIVHLTIDGKEIKPPLKVGSPGGLPDITVRTYADVSAKLQLEPGDALGYYELHVGGDSLRVYAEKLKGAIDEPLPFVYEKWDRESGRWIRKESFHLFQDAWGESKVFLHEYNSRKTWPILVIYANLDQRDKRGDFYDQMAQALSEQGFPHFVLSDYKGQMFRNKFSLKWRDGYTSTENWDVVLRVIGEMVRRELKPLLSSVNAAPQMSFENIRRRRSLSQISRMDGKTIRDIGTLMSRYGMETLGQAEGQNVSECARLATYDTPAHVVLADFLRSVMMARIEVIRSKLEKQIGDQERIFEGGDAFNPDRPNVSQRNMHMEAHSVLESLLEKKQYLNTTFGMLREMMAYPMLSHCRGRLTIYDVGETAFSSNDTYRRLYRLMSDYLRRRFWWVYDKVTPRFKIPEMKLCDNGETRLQYKYSIVYENWCYACLVRAAMELGYVYDHQKSAPWVVLCSRDDVDSRAVFRKDNIEIEILHGITAWAPTKKMKSEFVYTGGRATKKTPDFAIIIRQLESGDEKWIVADAKSNPSLKKEMVMKRIEYAHDLEYKEKKPLASILFRSGERDAEWAEVEIPPPAPRDVWPERDPEGEKGKFVDHSEDDYHWDSEQGIVEGDVVPPPYHGHVRVNVSSAARGRDVFEEFLRGMVRTVERMASR